MTIIAIILSSLALLAAIADLSFTIHERKRSKERNAALIQYADASANNAVSELGKRVTDLENGVIPNFEKAKAAANAINDFNAGISGILGFDPHEMLRKQRNENGGGD